MARHRKGSSRTGRPRKEGERYASGRLKPQRDEGNQRVREIRKALMGSDVNLENAENPMSLALARGWVTERQHRAGEAYRRLKTRAGLCGPKLAGGGLQEAPEPSVRDPRPIGQIPDAEIVAVFDGLALPNVRDTEEKTTSAMTKYYAIGSLLSKLEMSEIDLVVCSESWPFWLTSRCAGKFDTSWERKRDLLVSGLDKVGLFLFGRGQRAEDKPEQRSFGEMNAPSAVRKVEEETIYCDAAGNELYRAVVRRRA